MWGMLNLSHNTVSATVDLGNATTPSNIPCLLTLENQRLKKFLSENSSEKPHTPDLHEQMEPSMPCLRHHSFHKNVSSASKEKRPHEFSENKTKKRPRILKKCEASPTISNSRSMHLL
jgi:hypothetical protein